MAKFEVGQRVKVNYRGWEGEGIVREITPENWHHVDMLTGDYAHVQGDFNRSDLEPIVETFQPGDIVRAEKGDEIIQGEIVQGVNEQYIAPMDGMSNSIYLSDFVIKGYTLTLVKRPEPEIVLPTQPYAVIKSEDDVYILTKLGWANVATLHRVGTEDLKVSLGFVAEWKVIFDGEGANE